MDNKKHFKWTRQMIEVLIVNLEKHEVLYNVRHQDYIKQNKRAEAYEKILDDLKRANGAATNLTIELIKKKIHALRTQYSQELRNLQKYKIKHNGQTTEPKLWCFEHLRFLRKHLVQKTGTGKISPVIEIRNAPFFVDELVEQALQVDDNAENDNDHNDNDFDEDGVNAVEHKDYNFTTNTDVVANVDADVDVDVDASVDVGEKADEDAVKAKEHVVFEQLKSKDEKIATVAIKKHATKRKRSHIKIEISKTGHENNCVEDATAVDDAVETGDEFDASEIDSPTESVVVAKKSKKQKRIEAQNLLIIKKVKMLQEKLHYKLHNVIKDYNWVGEQVINEINSLKSDKIRKKAIWAIQDVLKNAILEDDAENEFI